MPLIIKVTAPCGTRSVDSYVCLPMQVIDTDTPDSVMKFADKILNDTFNQTATTARLLAPITTQVASTVDAMEKAPNSVEADTKPRTEVAAALGLIMLKIFDKSGVGHDVLTSPVVKIWQLVKRIDQSPNVILMNESHKVFGPDSTLREYEVQDGDTLWLCQQES